MNRPLRNTRTSNRHSRLSWLACAAFLCLFAGAASADTWIHVQVDDGRDGDHVSVNLPISLMRAAVNLIPNDVHADIEMEFDDVDFDWYELKAFWQEVKKAPEMTFVTIESRDEHIAVRKEGDMLVIRTLERTTRGAEVDVRLPAGVVDALLSGPEGRFDFAAALEALVDYGPGHLMTVRDGDDHVRIWIDDQPETSGRARAD